MEKVKVVLLGDGQVGKTSYLMTWRSGSFPRDYVPTVMDVSESTMELLMPEGNRVVTVSLWDTACPSEYRSLRPLSFPHTDAFLFCFALNSRKSLQNVRTTHLPEVRKYCPKTPALLVGLKGDLRASQDDLQGTDPLPEAGNGGRGRCISLEEAEEMAKEIGAVGYHENSALTQTGLQDTMMAAIHAGLAGQQQAAANRAKKFKWPWRKS